MKIRTWIMIADGARARLVRNDGIGKGVEPVTDVEAAWAHTPTRELGADRPGRTFDRAGQGRHAVEPPVDWHRFEKHQFAAEMAEILNRGAARGAFDRLVLVAPPETLGVLRAALDEGTRKKVTAELAKDLTRERLQDLPERLRDVVNL